MENIINLTENAIIEINNIILKDKISEELGLRLSVTGGGCSGLSYKIDFTEYQEKDNVINIGNIKIFIDPKSCIYLKDITLDYKAGLNGKGFIFENPNAKNNCGCGESFSI
jgi:iron-sulfur cluster assembly protein